VPRDLPSAAAGLLPRALAAAAGDPVRLDHAIGVLRGMSLLTADQPGQVRVHQLVQQVLGDRLDPSRPRSPSGRISATNQGLPTRSSARIQFSLDAAD
jgi:hypothetical protein